MVSRIAPDILVLQKVDYDLDLHAISALRDVISASGPTYPHIFALRPNTGMPTGVDMDGDGRLGRDNDAQGFGRFSGQAGMAVLSRFPIIRQEVQDFSALLWRDLPGALLPVVNKEPFPSAQAMALQRLSTVGHWVVPVRLDDAAIDLLVFHATPPVFDGPEDRNGKRNHDELRIWQHYLDGGIGTLSQNPVVLIGDANLDPVDGDGRKDAINGLLNDKRLQDPRPMRVHDVPQQSGQSGDPRLDTADWPMPDPGPKRVDYVLPDARLSVKDAGVFWPPDGTPDGLIARTASRHRLVWVDLTVAPE